MTGVESPVPALRLAGICKRFGSLVANHDISLDVAPGEVLALLGENGAGKSTLMAILFGHYVADAGSVEVFGKPLAPGNPRAALEAGVGMVHQHFTLADNLTVLDNVMLGSEALWWPHTRRTAACERLLQVARRFGLPVTPEARVGALSVGEKQRVELLKALYRGARVLILDEPTSVLTPQESEALFSVLAKMVADGLSIIFISHKLDEVMRVSDRVAVLRNGMLVAQARTARTSRDQLVQWMVGHAVAPRQRQAAQNVGAPVCVLDKVSIAAEASGRGRLQNVELTLHAGEIVAVAGVSGNGQAALAELLCGMRRPDAGTVLFNGRALPANIGKLVGMGIARVPEDRHGTGVVGDLPLWENAVSEHLRSAAFSRWGWVRRRAALAFAQRVIQRFEVRGAGLFGAARTLSGGNMQKLILGRALLGADDSTPAKRLIVAHQPTWGLDIGSVDYVQGQLIQARDNGAAILLISDDLDEVLALGDRIAVLHGGRLTAALPAAAWSRDTIGLAMAGTMP